MAFICPKLNTKCKDCPHYRFDEDRNDYSCFALQNGAVKEKCLPNDIKN